MRRGGGCCGLLRGEQGVVGLRGLSIEIFMYEVDKKPRRSPTADGSARTEDRAIIGAQQTHR